MRERWCWPPVVNAIGAAGGIAVVVNGAGWPLDVAGAFLIAGNLALAVAWWVRSRREVREAERWAEWQRSRRWPRYHTGGIVPGDGIPAILEPGGPITDPDDAEALGLTVEARRMRETGSPFPVLPPDHAERREQ